MQDPGFKPQTPQKKKSLHTQKDGNNMRTHGTIICSKQYLATTYHS